MADNDGLGAEIAAEFAAEQAAATAAEAAKAAAPAETVVAAESAEPVAEAASEAAETPESAVAGAEPEAVAAPKPKKPEPLPKWMKDRLAEQTAKQREAERLAAEAEARATAALAELEALRKRAEAGGDPAPVTSRVGPGPDYVPRAELDARAAEIARINAHNAAADQAYFAGKAAYSDFDSALEPLQHMGALNRMDFQKAALATGNAADVFYALGSDPDRASQILGWLKTGDEVKAGIEMDRIAREVAGQKAAAAKPKKTPVSQAPAPIKPVGGSALTIVDMEKLDGEDFDRELTKMLQGFGWGR